MLLLEASNFRMIPTENTRVISPFILSLVIYDSSTKMESRDQWWYGAWVFCYMINFLLLVLTWYVLVTRKWLGWVRRKNEVMEKNFY